MKKEKSTTGRRGFIYCGRAPGSCGEDRDRAKGLQFLSLSLVCIFSESLQI